MLNRSSSSRRRRASRSATSSPLTHSTSSRPTATSPGRRASIAVSPVESPRSLMMPEPNRSPRHSLVPDISLDNRAGCLYPENCNRSPRNSLVPSDQALSPRNSLVPDISLSPRNSLVPDVGRSPRHSLVPGEGYNRSPRGSLIPDSALSPRNSLVPENGYNRSPRHSVALETISRSPRGSLVPDLSRSPKHSLTPETMFTTRNSLAPDFNRSPRGSLVPDTRGSRHSLVPSDSTTWNQRTSPGDEPVANRSPRHSIAPDVSRSPRGSIAPEPKTSPRGSITSEYHAERSPRGSIGPDGISRSPRGSIAAELRSGRNSLVPEEASRTPRGSLTLTFQEPVASERRSSADNPLGSRSAGRSTSPYRSSRTHQGSETGSRRASSSVSQVSGDDQRRLCCEHTKLSGGETGLGFGVSLTTYGSVAYQLKDANMEASGTCDFVCRALRIVNKTMAVTVVLVCLSALPLIMLIMGIQFLRDCPREPHIPVYMVVGGSFGGVKMAWLLWRQLGNRRLSDGVIATSSAGSRVANYALTLFLVIWFALGNYWILSIKWPDYAPTLYEPNKWCHRTLYVFSLVHLCIIHAVLAGLVLMVITFAGCQITGCLWLGPTRYK